MGIPAAFAAILLLALVAPAAAEEDEDDEALVEVAGSREPAFESPRAVRRLTRRELAERAPRTTPEALGDEPGIALRRTSAEGAALSLRGRGRGDVLVLCDGVRLDSSIVPQAASWLGTLPPGSLERVEILRGSGAVLYGSGAGGGVIRISTRRPSFDARRAWDAGAELGARFDTADLGLAGRFAVEGHLRGVGLRAGGTLRRSEDLQAGRGLGRQLFTGYAEGDAEVSTLIALGDASSLSAAYHASRQIDVPRSDRSSNSDFLLVDREHDLATLGLRTEGGRWLRQIDATVSFQHQRERRDRFVPDRDYFEEARDRLASLGARLAIVSELPRNRLSFGGDLTHDWIASKAHAATIATGLTAARERGRYPDGSRSLQGGVYLLDRISLGSKLGLDAGARIGGFGLELPASAGSAALSRGELTWAASLHGRYLVGDGLNLTAGLTQGFRAPSLDDVAAVGCGPASYDSMLQRGDLKLERQLSAEAGVKLDLHGLLRASLGYSFTYLTDPVVRAAFLDGGALLTANCGLAVPVEMLRNGEHGLLHTLEADLELSLGRVELFLWAAWAHGETSLAPASDGSPTREPTSGVPPLQGLVGARYRIGQGGRSFAELALRWAAPQRRLSSADRRDPRICPGLVGGCDGTDGYALLRLRGGVALSRIAGLALAIENLTDAPYREHGSALPGAGTRAVIGLDLVLP
jgi:outer membrane receptor protein involved in Fe transport